jgi:AcrR family transcriptional regulator
MIIMTPGRATRPYRKKKRAESEEETRRRITEAAVELHGTVGPAKTSVTDIARLAGVSRMTVYNHFPTETELFTACSKHWATLNPLPDPQCWQSIADPARRLRCALRELYAWYALNEGMLGNVLRDTQLIPALAEIMEGFWEGWVVEVVRVLAHGWSRPETEELPAALRLATDYGTWRALSRAGLDPERAADMVGRMVEGTSGA